MSLQSSNMHPKERQDTATRYKSKRQKSEKRLTPACQFE
jgi:hypothetical protein